MVDAVTPDANLGPARVIPGDTSSASPPASRARIASLDIVRGTVMLLMAIDHVRVYSGLPPGGPTPGIFFTRWVTHFVAPAFVFLAGTGAWLYGRKIGDRGALARFLVTRGLWLVLLELTVIRVAWTFNFDFAHYMLAGVIWMIGCCMIIMAGLIALPLPVVGAFGVAMILGHNIMDYVTLSGPPSTLVKFLYAGGQVQLGADGPGLDVLFVIIPWVGVMAAGYAFGPVMRMTPERRRRACLALGGGAIIAFVGLRALDGYGDPRPWNHPSAAQLRAQQQQQQQSQDARPGQSPPTAQAQHPRPPLVIRFLNTSKYPASLLFLLMTLGPMLVAIPLLEHARGKVADVLTTFGRVPFFYYLLHIPAIHIAAIVVSLVRTGSVTPWLFGNHPMEPPPLPDGYAWSLPLLYFVWAIVVTALYFPCRWYAEKKAHDTSGWLSYV